MKFYQQLAEILEYPTSLLPARVKECTSLLYSFHCQAAEFLKEFGSFLDQTPFSQVEEIYTRTFDLQAICHPYVGYHLFGEDCRRGMFMARLQEHYRRHNFAAGNELPDHLGVMLRFLAMEDDGEEREELIRLCIIPSLQKMVEGFKSERNPYFGVLQALLLILPKKLKV